MTADALELQRISRLNSRQRTAANVRVALKRLDYGFQARSGNPALRGRLTERLTQVAVAAMLVAVIPLALLGQRETALARVRAWTLAGPPCPTLSEAEYRAFDARSSETFNYDGAHIVRAYGMAACAKVAADTVLGLGERPVCQFNAPGVLAITTVRGRILYGAGLAPATITLVSGAPHCVLGARLAPDWLRN